MRVEAARAAVLATHSAAGLALASSREAARLLRAAEALARSAVAVLCSPSTPQKSGKPGGNTSDEPPSGGTGVIPPGSSTRGAQPRGRRQRRRSKKQPDVNIVDQEAQRLDVVAPPRSVGSSARERVLVRRETLPPDPLSAPGSASPLVVSGSPSGSTPRPGLVYKLAELTARKELNHRLIKFLRRCEDTNRCVVQLVDDPVAVPFRVKENCLADPDPQGSHPVQVQDAIMVDAYVLDTGAKD